MKTLHRSSASSLIRMGIVCATALLAVGCQTTGQHSFASPASDWQTRAGQLQYRGPKTTLIGDVLVRYSKTGEFALTFSKGPGVTLMMLREDARVAHAEGPLARGIWEGERAAAPERLRGWIGLRELLARSPASRTLRESSGAETFVFQF